MQEDESGRDSGRAPEQGRPESEHRDTEAPARGGDEPASARGGEDSARRRAGNEAPHADTSGGSGPGRSVGGKDPARSRGDSPGTRSNATEADEAALTAATTLAAEPEHEEDGEVIAVVESDQQHSPVTPAVRGLAAWSWRFLVIVAATGVLIIGLIQVKTVVIPVLVAALIAALLAPVVDWLAKHRVPRALGALVAMLAAVAVIGALLTVAGAGITSGIQDLSQTAWQGLQDIITWFTSGPLQISESDINSYLDQARQALESNAQTILSGALSVGTTVGNVVAGLLIALFCLFFFLKDGELIWSWLVRLFPRVARERADVAGKKAWYTLGGYVRTQIVVAFCDGVGIGIGAWILGVPFAFALGVLVFIGSFIPIVGAIVTGFLAVAVALVSHGIWTAVIMLGVVLLVQQAESNLLQPLLMSRSLKLHPVAVLLAVAAGTIVAGIVGALFAVPLVAIANTVLHYLNGGAEPHREVPRIIQRVRRKT